MKKLWCLLLFILSGCGGQEISQVASFESVDMANKVIVFLGHHQILASLSQNKDYYQVYVDEQAETQARKVLTQFNFYFQKEGLNDLLDSKFASLSKLEMVKSNLLESREIYNKLSVIPNILRAKVVVTGETNKRISVLIMSFKEIDRENKNNIEHFLKGLIAEQDKLTVSYFSHNIVNEDV